MYYRECQLCGNNYIGETVRNTVTRWSEHNNLNNKSELAEHIEEILIMYLIGRFYAQLLDRNI